MAHPALVKVAKDIFDQHMHEPNQIDNKREDVHTTEADLLKVPDLALFTLLSGLIQDKNVFLPFLLPQSMTRI